MQVMQREDDPITAINVTPLVDVTLVLVIIFMITMPFLSERAMHVKSSNEKVVQVSSVHEPILLEVTLKGLRLENQPVAPEQLIPSLEQAMQRNGVTDIAVSADRDVTHGTVVQVLDSVMQAGAGNLDLLQPAEKKNGRS